MSDFKAKMHQIQFPLGLRSRPRWASLQRSPRPLAVFKGPTSNGREGKGWEEGKGKGKVGEGRKEGFLPNWGVWTLNRRAYSCTHHVVGKLIHTSLDTEDGVGGDTKADVSVASAASTSCSISFIVISHSKALHLPYTAAISS